MDIQSRPTFSATEKDAAQLRGFIAWKRLIGFIIAIGIILYGIKAIKREIRKREQNALALHDSSEFIGWSCVASHAEPVQVSSAVGR